MRNSREYLFNLYVCKYAIGSIEISLAWQSPSSSNLGAMLCQHTWIHRTSGHIFSPSF